MGRNRSNPNEKAKAIFMKRGSYKDVDPSMSFFRVPASKRG